MIYSADGAAVIDAHLTDESAHKALFDKKAEQTLADAKEYTDKAGENVVRLVKTTSDEITVSSLQDSAGNDISEDVKDALDLTAEDVGAVAPEELNKYLPLAGGKMTGAITGGDEHGFVIKTYDVTNSGARYLKGFRKDGATPELFCADFNDFNR